MAALAARSPRQDPAAACIVGGEQRRRRLRRCNDEQQLHSYAPSHVTSPHVSLENLSRSDSTAQRASRERWIALARGASASCSSVITFMRSSSYGCRSSASVV